MTAFEERPSEGRDRDVSPMSVLAVECRSGETRWCPYQVNARGRGRTYRVSLGWGSQWVEFTEQGRGKGRGFAWCLVRVGVPPEVTANEHKRWCGLDGSGLVAPPLKPSRAPKPPPKNQMRLFVPTIIDPMTGEEMPEPETVANPFDEAARENRKRR